MGTFYDKNFTIELPNPTLLGSGLIRLPNLIVSELETFVWAWTLKASDGDDLEVELDAHTFTYLVIDPVDATIEKTYTVAGGSLVVTASTGIFLIGGVEKLTRNKYIHMLIGHNTSTAYDMIFFEGALSVLRGAA